mmetsp:Transcript_41994/g.125711  ORF Transcript_41994/g.125711 Transcript_41994/m.125711 type:complete len:252 (+) Transcript_41994:623-1378(+)
MRAVRAGGRRRLAHRWICQRECAPLRRIERPASRDVAVPREQHRIRDVARVAVTDAAHAEQHLVARRVRARVPSRAVPLVAVPTVWPPIRLRKRRVSRGVRLCGAVVGAARRRRSIARARRVAVLIDGLAAYWARRLLLLLHPCPDARLTKRVHARQHQPRPWRTSGCCDRCALRARGSNGHGSGCGRRRARRSVAARAWHRFHRAETLLLLGPRGPRTLQHAQQRRRIRGVVAVCAGATRASRCAGVCST